MYAHKYETTVNADHHLSIDLPASFPIGPAEVIVLAKSDPQNPVPVVEPLTQLFAWLDTLPPSGRSIEEIEAQIREERDSWGD